MCLGDVTVEGILDDAERRCSMCGYRLPAEAHSPGPGRHHNGDSMTTARRDWPYASGQLRPSRA